MSSGFIDVCTCFDDGNVDAAIVLIQSIIDNKKLTTKIHFHAITSSKTFRCDNYFKASGSFAMTTYNIDSPFSSWPGKEYISVGTYLRFMIPDLIDRTARVLYLDADTVVNDDLASLHNIDLNECPLAAMPDYGMVLGSPHWDGYRVQYNGKLYSFNDYTQQVLGICKADPLAYFNAGVLLIDLRKWRNINERTIEYLQANPGLPFLDQDALSHVVAGHFVRLDPRYNAFSYLAFPDGRSRMDKIRGFAKDYAAIRKIWRNDPRIIHYAGSNKPWSLHAETTALEHIWWDYAGRSPISDRLAQIKQAKQVTPITARRC